MDEAGGKMKRHKKFLPLGGASTQARTALPLFSSLLLPHVLTPVALEDLG